MIFGKFIAVAAAAASLSLWGETNTVAVAQDSVTIADLKAENEALRRENQMLRRELVRRRGGEPVIDMSQKTTEPVPADDTTKIVDDGGYWLATKSMKRHNSKCRYYKMGKGRPCKKDEGTPCKKWIVSDFGLNDGIESGLVKTPRVVVRDDGQLTSDFKSKLYHIYSDETVKDDVNRAATPEESLPDLVQQAYYLLGKDWQSVYEDWLKEDCPVPPVMISVVNRTETAARVKYMFDHARMPIGNVPELCDSEKTIHIDSKTMDEAESEKGGSKKEAALALRRIGA